MILSRNDLADQVVDALRSFYDPARLRLSPLIGLLHLSDPDGQPSPAALRHTLREAIASLRPEPSIPLSSPAWIPYRILWSHYVQNQSREMTCSEIGLSQASYYRYRSEALAALTDVLWNQYQALEPQASPERELHSAGAESAIAEGLRMMSRSPSQPVDIIALLRSAGEMLEPVAQERGVSLCYALPMSLPSVHGHPTLLRQAFLYLLTDLLNAPGGPDLEISATVEDGEIHIALHRSMIAAQDLDVFRQQEGMRFSEGILGASHGRLWLEQASERLFLHAHLLVQEPKTILVIDDDTDAILLYQRYLEGYQVQFARHESEVRAVLAAHEPDLILLDLLMPEKDGWDILRYLRTTLEHAHTPVLVCSVLSHPQLALAMGATSVLQKPISQESLLAAVRPLLQRADSTS